MMIVGFVFSLEEKSPSYVRGDHNFTSQLILTSALYPLRPCADSARKSKTAKLQPSTPSTTNTIHPSCLRSPIRGGISVDPLLILFLSPNLTPASIKAIFSRLGASISKHSDKRIVREVPRHSAAQGLVASVEKGGVLTCSGISQAAQPFVAALLRFHFRSDPS
jgi:hypothetical protein